MLRYVGVPKASSGWFVNFWLHRDSAAVVQSLFNITNPIIEGNLMPSLEF